jgi:glycosyltransferase involved in cell wall biosynthesis
MKILFLFPHFLTPGGAANVVLQLARALQERNHEVVIICAKVSKDFRERNADLSFEELDIPTSNSILYWALFRFWQKRINERLNSHEDYVLFPHVLPSNWWAWMYKRKNRQAKVVWYCNEPSAFVHSKSWINAIPVKAMKWGAKVLNPLLKRIDIKLEKENDRVICNSNFTAQQYRQVYGRNATAIIYPPLKIRPAMPLKNKEKFVLTVGRLSKFKKIDVLIKALRRVLEQEPGINLVIVGDGEDRPRLKRLVEKLHLEHAVRFEGTVSKERLEALYKNAMVSVICAMDEPFGLVPIESMMYGTPVIAHNSGGPRETICHGLTGFLYNTEDELVELIRNVFRLDYGQYSLMQQQCIDKLPKYDIANAVVSLEKLLQSIAS